jgi:DNA-directed RNA polymerase alpha subunit
MARQRLTYRQRDLTAAIRALKAAGIEIARIDVHKDGVTLVPGTPAAAIPEEELGSGVTTEEEWERFVNERFGKSQKRRASGVAAEVGDDPRRRRWREIVDQQKQWKELGLPHNTASVLVKHGILTLPELAAITDDEMMKWDRFGPHSLDAVHRLLKNPHGSR